MTTGERTVYRGIPVLALPRFVLFPGALMQLRAVAPSHRRLVEDLLDTQGRLVLTAALDDAPPTPRGPALREVGTLVEIATHRRLAGGGYLLWLLGLERVHLTEVPGRRPYRQVDAVVLEDRDGDLPRARELLPRLRAVVAERVLPDAAMVHDLDAGLLADLLLQFLDLSHAERERALRERGVVRRAELALAWLARQDGGDAPEPPARGEAAGP